MALFGPGGGVGVAFGVAFGVAAAVGVGFGLGVVGFVATFGASFASWRYDVLKPLHWQIRHSSLCLRANDMLLS